MTSQHILYVTILNRKTTRGYVYNTLDWRGFITLSRFCNPELLYLPMVCNPFVSDKSCCNKLLDFAPFICSGNGKVGNKVSRQTRKPPKFVCHSTPLLGITDYTSVSFTPNGRIHSHSHYSKYYVTLVSQCECDISVHRRTVKSGRST